MQYPLSPDEYTAMARCLASVRQQLQDVSDLFSSRYGRHSGIAEIAVRTLASSSLLEHELMLLETEADSARNAIASTR